MKRTLLIAALAVLALTSIWAATRKTDTQKVVVAYVFRPNTTIDPTLMTHINYAFGHVTDTFNGVRINNPEHLKQVVALKKQNPDLKVLLSIGGWGSGNFSEMAADDRLRGEFAQACKQVADTYRLDGIDIDWEYPTVSSAGISSSPDDTENFTLLIRDLRKALGNDMLITLATGATAKNINFPDIMPYIDFVNIMAYDMATVPHHHASMHYADSTIMTVQHAVQAHIDAGVPTHKLVLGLPFYGKGTLRIPRGTTIEQVKADSMLTEHWNEEGQYPYLTDSTERVVYTFDNARSLTIKCQYALMRNLRGTMYWEASCDDDSLTLSRAVWHATTGK